VRRASAGSVVTWLVSGEVSAGFEFEGMSGSSIDMPAGSEKRLVGSEKSLVEILAGSEDTLADSQQTLKSVELGEREGVELVETH